MSGGLRKRAFGLFDEGLEGLGFTDGEVRQDLAVDLDASLREAVDKSAIGQAMLADGGVDALDPQGAEVPLAQLAADIGVGAGAIDSGLRGTDRVLAAAVKALGGFQDLLVLGVGRNAPLDARHGLAPQILKFSPRSLSPPACGGSGPKGRGGQTVPGSQLAGVGHPQRDAQRLGFREHLGAAIGADVVAAMAGQTVTLAGDAGLHLPRSREFEALFGARLGLQLGHFAPLSF